MGLIAIVASAAGPEYPVLKDAYSALKSKDYETAISKFNEAVSLAPKRTDIRKDLAYTYLKIGETELARDRFALLSVDLVPALSLHWFVLVSSRCFLD